MIFLDTNILLYVIGFDGDDERRFTALDCLASGCASVQAIAEMTNRLSRGKRRNGREPSSWPEIESAIEDTRRVLSAIVPLEASHLAYARQIAQTAKLSYFDAQMIAVAASNGGTTLLSEDLNHGQTVEGVRIVNPFR